MKRINLPEIEDLRACPAWVRDAMTGYLQTAIEVGRPPPVFPLLIWWDGLASTLRTYRAEELRALASEIQEPGYRWSVQELPVPGAPIPGAPIPVTLLVGRPTVASEGRA